MTRRTAGAPKASSNNKGPQQTNRNKMQKRAGTGKLSDIQLALFAHQRAWSPPHRTSFTFF